MKRILLALTILVFAVACSEDDTSTWSMELALDEGNYQHVINTLAGKGSLSDREIYLLQCAYMGKAGFDLVGNLDKFLDNAGSTTNVLGILLNSPNGKLDSVAAGLRSDLYSRAVALGQNRNLAVNKDKDIALATGLSASMQVVMEAIKLASQVGGTCAGQEIDLTNPAALNSIANCISGTDLATSFGSGDIKNALDQITVAAGIVGNGELQDKLKQITDNATSAGALANYIKNACN